MNKLISMSRILFLFVAIAIFTAIPAIAYAEDTEYGVYIDDPDKDEFTLDSNTLEDLISKNYPTHQLTDGSVTSTTYPEIDFTQSNSSLSWKWEGTQDAVSVEQLGTKEDFQGLKFATGTKVGKITVTITWTSAEKKSYSKQFIVHNCYRPEDMNIGSIFGTNTIPAATGPNQYFYGTKYAGYERVLYVKDSIGYPIVLTALVPMEENEYEWTPNNLPIGENGELPHYSGWTAAGDNNFDVAYCADSEVISSDAPTEYTIATVKDLDDRFTEEQQERLQVIIENSYPFITKEEFLNNLQAYADSHNKTISNPFTENNIAPLAMMATQFAIWDVTNDKQFEDVYILQSNPSYEEFGVIDDDYKYHPFLTTPEECINNTMNKNIPWATEATNNTIHLMLDYFDSLEYNAEVSAADPILQIDSLVYDEGIVPQGTVTGKILNYQSGDKVIVKNNISGWIPVPLQIQEDGSFTYSGAIPNDTYLELEGSRTSDKIQAVFYDSPEYQDFVGGKFLTVLVTDSVLLENKTTEISVMKNWLDEDGEIMPAPEGMEIEVGLYNGPEEIDKVILNEDNEWAHTWTDLDSTIGYTVKELTVIPGYNVTYRVDNSNNFTIINRKLPTETGNLAVEKTVRGTTTDEEFHFNIELSDSNINGRYGDMVFHNGEAQIILKDGERKTATDLPTGVWYIVTEEENTYQTTVQNGTGYIDNNNLTTVRFINTKVDKETTGSLSVDKIVTGSDGEVNRDFNFIVRLSENIEGKYGDLTFNNGVAYFTLRHNERVTADNLPIGAEYVVEEVEANQNGYTTIARYDKGTIEENKTVSVFFFNNREKTTTTITPENPNTPTPGNNIEIPNNNVPRTSIAAETSPSFDIPEEEVPLAKPTTEVTSEVKAETPQYQTIEDTDTPKSSIITDSEIPKTGDSTDWLIFVLLFIVSSMLIVVSIRLIMLSREIRK